VTLEQRHEGYKSMRSTKVIKCGKQEHAGIREGTGEE
jgi:hypothetical protein